jgi:two-component system, cell cycle sensor histidine kinase and response regulator CckA
MAIPHDDHTDAILSAVLETTDDLIWAVDAEEYRLLTFNSALARHFATNFGKTLQIGLRPDELFAPEKVARWQQFFRRAICEGPFSVEYRGAVKGQTLWLSFNRLIKDGRCFGVSCFARDIEPFERAIEAAQHAEDRFAKLFRHNPFPLAVTTATRGTILDANHALARLLGHERLDLIGRTTLDIGFWADSSERARFVEAMRSQGRLVDFAAEYRRRDGRLVHGLLACEAIDFDGVPCFLVSIADITPLRKAEQALRASELRYRAMIENAPEAIVLIDADTGRHVDANEKALRYSGYDQGSFFGLNDAVDLPPQPDGMSSKRTLLQHIAQAADGETLSFEWVHTRPDGQAAHCEVRMSPFPDPNRRLVWASIVDIEDRKRSEREAVQLRAQLEQAQRLESLGTLAGGIAHDFNNILCAIVGYVELALMDERDSNVRSYIEDIQRGTDRARELVRQILAFSRQTPHEKKPVLVASIVKEAVKLLRAALPATILVNQHYDSSGWVLTDPIQIHQVVMNLGTNASLAMRDHGGTLDFAVTEVELDANAAARHPGLLPGRHISLTVKDTGCGIAPESIGRIFEPFFTTRGKGEGTGLGLSVVYGIVKEAGGAILVNSEPGFGTTFDVLLPLCNPASAEDAPVAHRTGGRQRILFVDDDPSVAKMAKISLGQFGHEVSTFTDPSQAIEEFSKRAARFDVLVTDATMPRITGNMLAAAVKKIRPDLPMILVSGAEDRLRNEEVQEAGFSACLSKPYRPTALAQIIQDICEKQPSTRHCS